MVNGKTFSGIMVFSRYNNGGFLATAFLVSGPVEDTTLTL